jgi:hypothetical protein
MQKLQEEYNEAVANGDTGLANKIQQNMQDIEDKHEEMIDEMEEGYKTGKDIWKQFWDDVKQAALKALAEVIARQAISVLLSMGPIGWAILGIAAIAAIASSAGYSSGGQVKGQINAPGYELGGAAKSLREAASFMKGGAAEYLATGGPKGTDTVPAWLTPGEYVISKPMTDFIKRTGVVTSELINAIRMGNITPTPAFAGGGLVGNNSSYGGIGNGVNISELNVSIYAQTLDEEAISEAGPKIFSEFKKQLEMLGLGLVEV